MEWRTTKLDTLWRWAKLFSTKW